MAGEGGGGGSKRKIKGGDKGEGGAPEALQNQDDSGAVAGDKAGEPQAFELGDDHAALVHEALGLDEDAGGNTNLLKAFTTLGPVLGFDPDTASLSGEDTGPLIITALPIARAAASTGDEGRLEFLIPEDRRAQLARARALDAGEVEGEPGNDDKMHEDAFWTQICAELDANKITVQFEADVVETGRFTAWPREEEDRDFNPATNEADHIAGVDRIEALAEGAEFDLATLRGDIRDVFLDIYRTRHKSWDKATPSEQRDISVAIDEAVQITLRKAGKLLAAAGRSSITATLERYADKGGEITATVKIVAADDATVLALHRASGKAVMIVSADADAFMGQRREPQIDREDPELAFEAGNDAGARASGDDDLAAAGAAIADENALYGGAVELVRREGKAGPSFLQRKLQIAYSVAEAITARMVAEGVISGDTSGGFKILPFEAAPGDGSGGSGEPGDESEDEAPAAAETA